VCYSCFSFHLLGAAGIAAAGVLPDRGGEQGSNSITGDKYVQGVPEIVR
jgi:hypothetical protein